MNHLPNALSAPGPGGTRLFTRLVPALAACALLLLSAARSLAHDPKEPKGEAPQTLEWKLESSHEGLAPDDASFYLGLGHHHHSYGYGYPYSYGYSYPLYRSSYVYPGYLSGYSSYPSYRYYSYGYRPCSSSGVIYDTSGQPSYSPQPAVEPYRKMTTPNRRPMTVALGVA